MNGRHIHANRVRQLLEDPPAARFYLYNGKRLSEMYVYVDVTEESCFSFATQRCTVSEDVFERIVQGDYLQNEFRGKIRVRCTTIIRDDNDTIEQLEHHAQQLFIRQYEQGRINRRD